MADRRKGSPSTARSGGKATAPVRKKQSSAAPPAARGKKKAASRNNTARKAAASKSSNGRPRRAGKKAAARRSRAKPDGAASTRLMSIRELDPQAACGDGTTVMQLFRVDDLPFGNDTTHLVFLDRHGWYCAHGRECPAVAAVRKRYKHVTLTR